MRKLKKVKVETHGKEEKVVPTTLEQIWGDKGNTRYKTMKEDEYVGMLNQMNKADLQAHASKLGIVPIDNREILVRKLLKEFRLHVSSYRMPAQTSINAPKVSKEVLSILAEGR
jgi:hypothetical protein